MRGCGGSTHHRAKSRVGGTGRGTGQWGSLGGASGIHGGCSQGVQKWAKVVVFFAKGLPSEDEVGEHHLGPDRTNISWIPADNSWIHILASGRP